MNNLNSFTDRAEAGEILAKALQRYRHRADTVVLALPRGGVPVAYQIALSLHLTLDVFLVRKLGIPGHEECAMGAIAEENIQQINSALVKAFALNEMQIQSLVNQEKKELQRRLHLYRHGKPLAPLQQKTIILVDDGIATGETMKAAIMALNSLQPKNIIVAVPVASKESLAEIKPLVADLICLLVPDIFYSVGQWYEHFPQISDQEVVRLLNDARATP